MIYPASVVYNVVLWYENPILIYSMDVRIVMIEYSIL